MNVKKRWFIIPIVIVFSITIFLLAHNNNKFSSFISSLVKQDENKSWTSDEDKTYVKNKTINKYGEDVQKINLCTINGGIVRIDSSVFGWCMKKGAALYGYGNTGGWGYVKELTENWESSGSDNSGSVNWLMDNIIRYGNSVDNTEKDFYKNKLNSYGISVNGLDDDQIFTLEQYALWKYTNNHSVNNDRLDGKLVSKANANSKYSLNKTEFDIDNSSVKINYSNNIAVVGPFNVKNNGFMHITAKANNVNLEMFSDANCQNKISEYTNYAGNVYVKVNNPNNNTNIVLSGYEYITTARYYTTTGNPSTDGSNQPFLMIDRAKSQDSKSFNYVVSGSYHINVKKKSTTNANQKVGAKFKLTQKLYGANTANESTVEIKNTEEQKTVTFNGKDVIDIDKDGIGVGKPDTYTISEVEVEDGYQKLDLSGVTLYVYKKIDGTKLQVDYVRAVINGKNVDIYAGNSAELTVKNTNDFKIEVSSTAFAIEVKNAPILGSYNMKIAKRDANTNWSESTNNSTLNLADAKFKVRQYLNIDEQTYNNAFRQGQSSDVESFLSTMSAVGNKKEDKYPISQENNWVSIYNSDIEINKNSANKIDIYAINEESAPSGYNKNANVMYLKVTKKVNSNGDKYCIDSVKFINSANGQVIDERTPNVVTKNENGGFTYYVNKSGNYKVAFDSSSIFVTYENNQIEGNYNLQILKRSSANDWEKDINDKSNTLAADFSVRQYLNQDNTDFNNKLKQSNNNIETALNGLTKSEKNVKTQKDAWTTIYDNVKITKNDVNLIDIYALTETNAPDGYNKNNNTMYLKVYKTVKSESNGTNKYYIDKVKFMSANGNELDENVTDIQKTNNGNYVYYKNKSLKYMFAYNSTSIMVFFTNQPIDGSYKMNIVKRDINDNSNSTTNLGSAEFAVNQYLNGVEDSDKSDDKADAIGYTSNSKNSVKLEKGVTQDIYYSNSNVVKITDITKVDAYTFEEKSAPAGYEKSNLKVLLQVYKTKKTNSSGNFEYVIDKIKVITRMGDNKTVIANETLTLQNGNGSIYIDKDGKKIDQSNNATVNISVANENVISVVWKDYPTGSYKLKAQKIDVNGNALTGAKFSLNELNKTNNLFENDGAVKTSNTDKGYTSTYEKSISNDTVSVTDSYVIKETQAPQNYMKLKNAIRLDVTKTAKVTKGVTTYELNTITATSYDGADKEVVLDFAKDKDTEKLITGVLLEDGVSTANVRASVSSDGIISVKFENVSLKGGYSLNIHKEVDGTPTAGINFILSGAFSSTASTNNSGDTRSFYKEINKNNVSTKDEVTIQENTNNPDIVGLKNKIKLEITKGNNSSSTKYRVTHINVWEDGKTQKYGSDISESGTTNINIPGVELTNNTTVTLKLEIVSNSVNQTIKLYVDNTMVTPKTYKLKIKKVDSDSKDAIDGRKFNVYKVNSDETRTLIANNITTANGGIATIGENFKLENNTTDRYVIQEVYSNNENVYVKIENYEWFVNINKTGSNLSTYALSDPSISVSKISGKTDDSIQADIAKGATIEKSTTDDGLITITIPNQKLTNFSLNVKKVTSDGNALNGSKFTIVREQNSLHSEASLSNVEPNSSTLTTSEVKSGEIFTFRIYENSAATGYKNLFQKASDGTQGYLKIKIRVLSDGSGNIVQDGSLVWSNAITDKDKIINDYLKNVSKTSIVNCKNENGNHSVEITLPNILDTTSTDLVLNKHSYGNKNNKLAAVQFNAKRASVSGNILGLNNIVNALNNGTNLSGFVTSSSDDSEIESLSKANVNTTYLYEITESASLQYHNTKIEKAIIKIFVKDDKTTEASIVAIKLKGGSSYVEYSSNVNYADRISLDSLGNNKYKINWANDKTYTLQLLKKQITTNDIPEDFSSLEGISANFTIKEISPAQQTIIENKSTDLYTIVNNDAKLTEYQYTIQEISATSGFQNLFKDKTIKLYVNLNDDGTIAEGATYFEILGCSSKAQENWLKNYVRLSVVNNEIKIYIANPKEKLGIELLKVTNSSSEGIEGVTFGVTGTGDNGQLTDMGNFTTNSSGTFSIESIPILKTVQYYMFEETSVPNGVTKLQNTRITLTVDTTGISSPSEITSDKLSIKAEATGAGGTNSLEGLSVDMVAGRIVITVPNQSKTAFFRVVKQDNTGKTINGVKTDEDGNIVNGVKIKVSKQEGSKANKTLFSDYIPEGSYSEGYTQLLANSEYTYTIRELGTKLGYVNILQGYNIKLHLKTDANANIKEINSTNLDQSNGNSYYEIEAAGTTKYSLDEILNNNMIEFELSNMSNGVVVANTQFITVKLKNPIGYVVRLNKKDLNGNDVKASITAVNKTDSRAKSISMYYETTKSSGGAVYMKDGEEHTWEIKETAASSPYTNILKDKVVNVITKWDNQSLVVKNWNIDGNANSEYKKYVDVSTQKVDGIWTLIVTIKDPIKVKVKLNKIGQDGKPLTGANLTLKSSQTGKTVSISGGASESDYMEEEISLSENNNPNTFGFEVTESSTALGHVNVLKDKTFYLRFVLDEKMQLFLGAKFVINNGKQEGLSEDYYSCEVSKDDSDEYVINITIKNPVQYKLRVVKKDSAGNLLYGSQIKINSPISGIHYTDGKSHFECIEEGAEEGKDLIYYISEIYTAGANNGETPYVNKLGNSPIWMIVNVSNTGEVSVKMACVFKFNAKTNKMEQLPIADFGVSIPAVKTDANGIQNIEVDIENPTSFNFELIKKQADSSDGTEGSVLSGAEFKITSSASGVHQQKTSGKDGNIILSESGLKAGDYKFKIEELNTANENYVNILDDNYVEVNVNVNAGGDVTFKNASEKFTVYQANGTKITDAEKLSFYNKYISVSIDKTSKVNKVQVKVINPVKVGLKLVKETTDGTALNGAKFSINNSINNTTITKVTANGGIIESNEKIVTPGVYKYEITEINSADKKYSNILDGYKIVFFVKIHNDGYIELVEDDAGTAFSSSSANRFYVYNSDNADVTVLKDGQNVIKYMSVQVNEQDQQIVVTVQNPVKFNIDLTKVDTANGDASGALFTIYRNDECIFHSGVVNKDAVEVVEDNMVAGEYVYYISEAQSMSPYTYVNVFKNNFIKVYVKVNGDGTVQIIDSESKVNSGYFEIYEGSYTDIANAKLISRDNELYTYVQSLNVVKDSNGISTIKMTIENPTQYELRVIKNNAGNSQVKGSKFTAYREQQSNGKITKVLDNEEPIRVTESPVRSGNYIYYITENSQPGSQYINVLEGKYVKVYIRVNGLGKVYITNSKFQDTDGYYELYEGDINQRNGKKIENSQYVKVSVPNPMSYVINWLQVDVTNPVKYLVDITKTDSSNNKLDGANFTVKRKLVSKADSTRVFNGNVTDNTEIEENNMLAGNYIYYFAENSTPGAQYSNVLKDNYLKVYVKVAGDGTVTITDSTFTKKDGYFELRKGNINNPKDSDEILTTKGGVYYGLFNVGVTKQSDNINVINVKVVNPVNYKVVLNKKVYGSDEINLKNANFTIMSYIYGEEHTGNTDANGNIEFTENNIKDGIYEYRIKENSTPSDDYINILKDKEIRVFVKVNSNGSIEIVDKYGQYNGNVYYVYDVSGSSGAKEISKSNIISDCVNISISTNNNIYQLDIKVKNPQKISFSLVKKDKDTNKAMNGVKFKLGVLDTANNKKVDIRDVNTLNVIDTNNLVTKNVNGTDGVISLDNILIEKAGTYNFVLHEESTDGIFGWIYKPHKDDIVIKVTIAVENGKYVIKSAETTSGATYVSGLNFKTGIETDVLNERVKGKYDLILNKIDSYTGNSLDGAVFNISVEKDGKEHKLYKSTNDVDSMEQILPANNVTVNNGKLEIKDIRIEEDGRARLEEYTIILTEVKAPNGYMLLDSPIKLKVTTNTTGEYDNEKYVVQLVELVDDGNHGLVTLNYDENKIEVTAKNEYFDLALRKSITSVSYPDSDESEITEDETKDRVPNVVTDDLNANKSTTATYNHNKTPIGVYKGQEIIYTLRVYNEGEIDGYAEEITDHLPAGLNFVNDDFNKNMGWYLDNSDITNRTVKTTYLSKKYGQDNNKDNLLKAKNNVTGELDSREVQIKCVVSDTAKVKTILTNIAEISLSKAENRTSATVDRDSTTNNVELPKTADLMSKYKEDELSKSYVPGQEDDDDFEKVIVEEFDLALRKYITAVNGEEMLKNNDISKDTNDEDENDSTNDNDKNINADDVKYEREPIVNVSSLKDGSSTTATYTHPKDPVEVSVDDIVRYTISVYNEGTVSGYASVIKDDIPEGLEFVKDSEINKKFGWTLVDENDEVTDDVTKAKYIVSDYLSKENGEDNLLNAFDGEKLDTKYVQVEFKVVCKQDYPKVIENQAQISKHTDKNGKNVKDRDSTPNVWKGEDDEDVEYVKVTYMDLALRKFITNVSGQEIASRIPEVDATALKNETGTTATYKHPKDPVLVHTSDIVTYTIRVYNEGSKDGYATQIKDDIPDGLEFVPDDETNKLYEWHLIDENGNEVTDVSKAKCVVTNYLSKDEETVDRQNLIKAYDKNTMDEPEFKDVKISFKVVEPTTSDRILINYAQISEQTDSNGIHRQDRDSTPNVWKGEDDEDIEKVKVLYFDLALRKWVTKAIVIENGKTSVTETGHHAEDDPEEVIKVDLKKSKLNSVVVKFEYQIRITNEGEIAGYAKEIKDRIPQGLKFDKADNANWTELEDGIIVTDQLKDKLLQPGESAEVTVVLTWINSETNMGVKINIAEISKDYNKYGTPDIDSTPDNNVEGEDDIDDAPVMLTIKTGAQELEYAIIGLAVFVILILGVSVVKDTRKSKK